MKRVWEKGKIHKVGGSYRWIRVLFAGSVLSVGSRGVGRVEAIISLCPGRRVCSMDVTLVMFKETGERKDFTLAVTTTVVGRTPDCDLRIPLTEVSRKHCQFVKYEDRVVLQDLGSSNGTYVNNKRVAELQLEAGDHVVVGPVVFTVQIDGEPLEVKPVRTRLEHKPRAASMAAPGDTNLDRKSTRLNSRPEPPSRMQSSA